MTGIKHEYHIHFFMLLIVILKIKVHSDLYINQSLVSLKLLLRHRPVLSLLTELSFEITGLEWYGRSKKCRHPEKTFWPTKHSAPKQVGFQNCVEWQNPIKNLMICEMENQTSSWLPGGKPGKCFLIIPPLIPSPSWRETWTELCWTVWKPLFYLSSYQTIAGIRMIRKAC